MPLVNHKAQRVGQALLYNAYRVVLSRKSPHALSGSGSRRDLVAEALDDPRLHRRSPTGSCPPRTRTILFLFIFFYHPPVPFRRSYPPGYESRLDAVATSVLRHTPGRPWP
jgi:hypothetical protein